MDACCLNRLTDDQSQGRIRNEAEAVESILRAVREGKATWVSSTALEIEFSRNPDADRRRDVVALHLACAEQGRVDVFPTTDDDLVRRAGRRTTELRTRIRTPVS